MASPWNGTVRRIAAGAVLLFLPFLAPVGARAASSTLDVPNQVIVQVTGGARSDVTVRGWYRPTVQVDSDDDALSVAHQTRVFGNPKNPMSVTIPLQSVRYRDAGGGLVAATLPPEDFPYSSELHPGAHEIVRITAAEGSRTTVMVPATTGILVTRIRGSGTMTINDYRGTTLLAFMQNGHMNINNVATSAFLQPLNGVLRVSDSSFDRLRMRANTGTLMCERCRSRQVEATTLSGPIVYDNGTFDSGLARFESTTGHVAIGVANGAQVAARSGDGKVYGMWDRRTVMQAHGENEATASVGGGGPLVNAVTGHGNVFVYDGSLSTRRNVPLEWRTITRAVRQSVKAEASDTFAQPASGNAPEGTRVVPHDEHQRPVAPGEGRIRRDGQGRERPHERAPVRAVTETSHHNNRRQAVAVNKRP